MMGSYWQKAKIEDTATQIIISCEDNFKKHGDAFTWADGELNTVLSGKYIIMEEYTGNLKAPAKTLLKNGMPQIFRVTNELLEYAEQLII